MANEKARLSETLGDLMKSGMKKKFLGTFYRTTIGSDKKREKCWKNIGKTRNDK